MKIEKVNIVVAFFLLSVINVVIFIFRDQFIYHKYGTFISLYNSNSPKWKQFVYDYPASELVTSKGLLDSSIDVKGESATEKIIEIGTLLYSRFSKKLGKPSATLLSSSPLRQYQILCSSDSEKIWCGVYANMFAFFCWSEGVPCRIIEILNPGDHHVLNECYLPEYKQWVMVDLTYNRVLVKDSLENRFMNFFEVLNHKKNNVLILPASKDSIGFIPVKQTFYDYYLASHPLICYYYRTNNFEVYKPGEKIKRYLLPIAWYEEVNGNSNNFFFYTKTVCLISWLILLLFFLILGLRRVIKNSKLTS